MGNTWRSLALCVSFAFITVGMSYAEGHRGHGANPSKHTWRAGESAQRDHDRDRDRDRDRDWRRDHDRDRDWDADASRGNYRNHGQRYGWSEGKKTGWSNCDAAPGQAKKDGCAPAWGMRSTNHRSVRQRRVRTRRDGRRTHVRRDRDGDHDRD